MALTKSAAKELARFGLRCNAILPGLIETPIIRTVPDKVMQGFMQQIPLGRLGKAMEVAETGLFLASDASSYITGTTLEVTGTAASVDKTSLTLDLKLLSVKELFQ